jgi:hypothetical protein
MPREDTIITNLLGNAFKVRKLKLEKLSKTRPVIRVPSLAAASFCLSEVSDPVPLMLNRVEE